MNLKVRLSPRVPGKRGPSGPVGQAGAKRGAARYNDGSRIEDTRDGHADCT